VAVIASAWIGADDLAGDAGDADRALPWWSFSKTVIAALAAELAGQGVLDLDARDGAPWTLRQLLQHRAGVPCYGRLADYHAAVARGDPPWSRAELMARIGQQPDFVAGESWAYSNVGYMLARERIEAAAGEDIEVLARRVFGRDAPRLARVPEDFADVPGAQGYHPGWVYHGCFMGPAVQAVRLVRHMVTRYPELAMAHSLGAGPPGRPWSEAAYGLGTMAGGFGTLGQVVGHSGVGPFNCCAVYHLPATNVSVAVFAEGSDEGVPEREVVRLLEHLSVS